MRRHLGAVGLVILVGLSTSASMPARAAVTPLAYDDAAGDPLDTRPSMDILKVGHDFRQVNKAGPQSLVYEMTLAGPPETQLVGYNIRADVGEECWIHATFTPSTAANVAVGLAAAMFYVGCGEEGEFIDAKFLIKGNVLTWSIAFDSLPKPAREIGVLSNLYSFTHIADPALGIYGNGYVDFVGTLPTATDSASTDKTFKFGS